MAPLPSRYNQFLIDALRPEGLDLARWPMYGDGVNPGCGTQTEMQSRIAGRLETRIRANLSHLGEASGLHLHSSAKPIAIRTRANGLNAQPMSGLGSLVSQQERRPVEHANEQVFPAILKKSAVATPRAT